MRVLVTGVNGFVGRAFAAEALARGWQVRGAVRCPVDLPGVDSVQVGDIGPDTDWQAALQGCDAVVHLAAHVHRMERSEAADSDAFRRVNVVGSEMLARQAVAAGVRRLLFVSTVKVHGEGRSTPYSEADPPAPTDPYGCSKWEAEQVLTSIAGRAGLELVILRPPLVYGAGAGANFRRLMVLVQKRLPLPLGAVSNRRSLIHVDNLAHAIATCVEHPQAAGETFLLADGALSSAELMREMARALGSRLWLPSLPPSWIERLARWCGFGPEVQRLLGSLEVDDSKLRTRLGWAPPTPQPEALRQTALAMARRQSSMGVIKEA